MAASAGTVTLDLDANSVKLIRELQKAQNQTRRSSRRMSSDMSAALKKIGRQAALFGAAFGALAIRAVVKATEEQDAAVAQLNASLKSTGRFTEETSRALQEHAAALQAVTTFGDEAIVSAQSQLLTFTQLGTEVFPRATAAVLDLSAKMGTDLRSSVVQIGKALNDPILGVTALARSGIQFTVQQKELIKTLVESGDVLSAQKIILQELENQFGGSAKAARNTFGGALKGLQNSFDDLLEGDTGSDGIRGAIEAINQLSKTLNDPSVKEGFARLTEGVVKFIGKMVQLPAAIGFVKDEIKELFGVIAQNDFDRREDEIAGLEEQLTKAREKSINIFGRENSLFSARARSLEIEIRLKKESLELDRLASVTKPKVANVPALLDLPAPNLPPIIDPKAAAEIEKVNAALADLFQQVQLFGATDRDKALLKIIDTGATEEQIAQAGLILDELANLQAVKERMEQADKDRNDLEKEYAALIQNTRTESEQQAAVIDRIIELYKAGLIPNSEEFQDILRRTKEGFKKAEDQVSELNEFMIQAARNTQNIIADSLKNSFDDGFKGIIRGFGEMLLDLASQAAAAQIGKFLFGNLGNGSPGGGIFGLVAKSFGGGKAAGGPIDSGRAFLVGERGPEIIVPRGSGTVIPNNRLGGNSVVVNIDARESDNPGRLLALVPLIQSQIEQSITLKRRRGFA